jgi:hypothetical protein
VCFGEELAVRLGSAKRDDEGVGCARKVSDAKSSGVYEMYERYVGSERGARARCAGMKRMARIDVGEDDARAGNREE